MADIMKQLDLNDDIIKDLINEKYEKYEENENTDYEKEYYPGDEQCYLWYWEEEWRKEYGDYVIDYIKENYIKLHKILTKEENINNDFNYKE